MIEFLGLEKSYRGRQVLSGATLTVEAGESLALVGANGSGKTTTLRCAVGLAKPDGGTIRIDGIDIAAEPRLARTRLSYLAQRTDFPSTLTVREILRVIADLRGAHRSAVDREISLCGLDGFEARTAGTLSGGERQRVAVAALLIPDAAVYLLDEPTLNLDPLGTRLLIARLASLRDEGRTVVFTTHVNDEVDGLATRVASLRDGRFVAATERTSPGERHVSLQVHGDASAWIDAALATGATLAWAKTGRLHAMVGDSALSGMLKTLEAAGARISAFRTETALTTALDTLNHEDNAVALPTLDRRVRRTAPDGLWRHARWARVDPAGSR